MGAVVVIAGPGFIRRVVWGRNGGGGGKEGSNVATGFQIWDDAGRRTRK